MPLVRVQVRNEYGLGRPELYKGTNKEDPKAVLDGVVVAGLVGILRQLGDLADFAAEVFHGLQEQVLTTASRSHKLMLRAQNIEASLPPLEKAILAQTSHIHFAYTPGCEWHSRAKTEQNHFIYNDLPQFIMDSYEECRNPPCLHLLDKYDPGGQGSCLRRYSDPTFFKRVLADSDEAHIDKTEISRKTSRSKKKRLSRRNGETLQVEQMHNNGGRRTSSSQTADVVLESDLEDHSSVDSRADVGQRKSLSRRNGETFLGDQMHGNDGRQTSSSQTADVVLESDLEDHSYSVDSRADVGQRKSFSQRNGETLQGEHMLSNDGRLTSSSETADTVLESDLEDHSYSVDSRTDVGLRKSLSQGNGETLQGEQMHSNNGRMQFASHVNGQTSSSQTVVVLESDLEDHSYSVNSRADVEQRKKFSCRNGETLQGEQMHSNDGRMQLASHVNGQTSSSQTADMVLESDLEDHSYSVDLRDDAGYIECVFQPSNSVQFDEQERKELPSPRLTQKTDSLQSTSPTIDYNFSQGSFDKQIASTSTGLTWDEKEEIVDSESQWCDRGEIPEVPVEAQNLYVLEDEPFAPENSDFMYGEERSLKPASSMVQTDETDSDSEPDNYLDALNTIESESENDLDCETKREAEQFTSHVSSEVMGNGVGAASTELDHDFYNVFSHSMSNVSLNKETGLDFPETLQEIRPHISERQITSLRNPVQSDVPDNIEGTNILVASYDYGSPIHEPVPEICGNSLLDCSVGLYPLDNTCSLNDTVSTSIETVPSNALANIESERSLVDSHDSESPIHEQEPHQPANYILERFVHGYDSGSPTHEPVPDMCGNSVLDCSVGPNPLDDTCSLIDTVSTSIETVLSNAPVNIESIKQVDSHGSQSPTHEQEPHQPANYVLDCFVHGYDSGSPIHGPVPDISGNSVLDCSVGLNPLDDTCSFNDTVSPSIETVPSIAPVNIESKRKVDSHGSESPTHEQEPHQPANYVLDCFVHGYDSGSPIYEPVPDKCGNSVLDCSVGPNPLDDTCSFNDTVSPSSKTVPSNAPVNIESKRKVDSHGSESPTHEQDPYQPANYVLDCSDDVHILDNAVSESIKPVQSNVNVDTERTESLGDAPEDHHIRQQVPRICGNSVVDNAHNDSLSASSESVRPDGFVNSETAKNLADSHAHQSPIHEQMSHVCENSALECSVGTNPLGDYPTLNDSVSASIEIDPSADPVDFERTMNLAGSHGSVSTIHEQLPHISGNSVLNCLGGTSPLGDDHTLHDTVSASIETDISSGSKGSDLPDKEADSIDSNVCKSIEAPSELLSDPSVGLWTNGGLLGLEPSKPPDFIMPSSLNQGLVTSTNDTDGVSNYNSMLKSNGIRGDQDLSKIAELNQKEPRRYGQNDEDFHKNAPGTVVPLAHTGFTEPIKGSGLNSPLLFGLSHKLLINSFCRKVSFDEKSGPDNAVKTGLLEQSGQNSTVQQSLPETTFKEQVSYEYPTYSPPPSPPLEHMEISFCPVDRFETFKLKLKFPDTSHHSDSTRDVFPSFWLVPEHSILLHDSGSNSDGDDTFCRSSTFVSDDCLSPRSDYNSDQWESDDTPDISGDGVYDSSHRISLIESNSSSQEVRGLTDVDVNLDNEHIMLAQDSAEPSLSGHLLDFPSFDTMNPVLGKEFNNHSDYDDNLKLQGYAESVPPTPPLPPNQWWLSNQRSDMMNDRQNCMSKVTEQINDPNISESSLQFRPTLVEQNPTDHKSNDDILDKLRNKKKGNQVGIEKDVNEKEDFLHQIRTKSFNKKHTEKGKPNDITSPTTTDKVAAILEKANAIRQVISSDDGEDDDCWSES
ncbi:hypothetical protein K1719_008005 [Acacia pycnantha]|nr:hypothetical protein K1719_008005 [Acacia pycnantha]